MKLYSLEHTKFILTVALTILISARIHTQQNNPYIIPRNIFIGDPAVLIVPLPSSPAITTAEDIVLAAHSPDFPSHPDIDFHRIILERRAGGSRLMIEFTAFVPGVLELPVIKIGGEYLLGLTVTVNSIIENRSSVILSAPASSLAMPGTAIMLYGSMAALVFLILLTIWFILKGQVFIYKLREKWKYRMLFISIKITEKRLYRSVLKEENKRLVLDKLSEELRNFLSRLTGINCRALTAGEFQNLPLELPTPSTPLSATLPVMQAAKNHEDHAMFLQNFFRSCDELRFSGAVINSENIFSLLADLRSFLHVLELGRREKGKRQMLPRQKVKA